MSILSELYHSEINYSDSRVKERAEKHRLADTLDRLAAELDHELDENSRRIFEQYRQTEDSIDSNAEEAAFVSGFCIGAKIIIEIIMN